MFHSLSPQLEPDGLKTTAMNFMFPVKKNHWCPQIGSFATPFPLSPRKVASIAAVLTLLALVGAVFRGVAKDGCSDLAALQQKASVEARTQNDADGI